MKKIAFYVEGLTEQFFINKLLIEIAGKKNIHIELQQFQGIGKPKKNVYPKSSSQPINPKHHALIFDCVGDGGVKPRILENCADLFAQGYTEIIGLLDLYPRLNLEKFENDLKNGIQKNGKIITQPLPNNTEIIVAVNEVETWFLAEFNHLKFIDEMLNIQFIETRLGFNLCKDDMTLREHPALDLHNIYQLAGKAYMDSNGKKQKNRVERTVECLDYGDIYLKISKKIIKLNDLITKINNFLT